MSLNDVVGQDKAIKILSAMIKGGRVATSFLFSGIGGIGKRYTALEFAKAVNCRTEASVAMGVSCDICNSCRKINSLIHPDLKIISPYDVQIKDDKKVPLITIDEIRPINEFLSYTPSEGRKKVVIIDDADKMNPSAGNALLKTLEEPPSNSIIILITPNESTLLKTIVSRCIKITFVPLSNKAMKTVLNKNGEELNTAQIKLCRGSVEGVSGGEIFIKRDEAFKTLQDLAKGTALEKWKEREDMEEWFATIIPILRDMVILKINGADDYLINSDIKDDITRLIHKTDIKKVVECFDVVYGMSRKLYLYPNKLIVQNYMSNVLRNVLI